LPDPAFIGGAFGDVTLEPFFEGKRFRWH
jgi:hypothetical protein